MLAKINRLNKSKDIERVLKKGEIIRHNCLNLRVLKNNINRTRFSFVVSLKIAPKIVLRNKIKRRLREIVRLNLKNIKTGLDIVIFAQKGIGAKNFQQIESDIVELFKISGVLK